MLPSISYLQHLLFMSSLFLLTACGGGSSNNSDSSPDAFSFASVDGVALNTSIESNTITISGINTAVAISISGGEYAIASGAFTASAGTISNGQSVQVRLNSANALNQSTSLTLTVGEQSATFTVTTRSVDAAGLYEGTGNVNAGTTLSTVKAMVHNDRMLIFDEAENVLYDGQISQIIGNVISAQIAVYKDGVNGQQTPATGSISGSSFNLTLTGTGYGSGTLTLTTNTTEYSKAATGPRFDKAIGIDVWAGDMNSVTQLTNDLGIQGDFTGGALMEGGPDGSSGVLCDYQNGTKTIPNNNINIYLVAFDSVDLIANCNHSGTGYSGIATIVNGSATDDTMWFAATNGTNSTFSILTFVDN